MMIKILISITALVVFACDLKTKTQEDIPAELEDLNENLPADGFNIEGSSVEAIMVADKVMQQMGGRKAWDETRYISWTFFGRRSLIWDKRNGDVRITFEDSDQVIIVNIHSLEGKVFNNGREITDSDSLASYLEKGKSIWMHDSYWLVMPFKLKDSGVTLHFIGEDTTQDGRPAHFFQMTFEKVGDAPENVYNIWVDAEDGLISQWAFFKTGEETVPNFITPWADYHRYGKILLSGNRGKEQLTNIKVSDEIPAHIFTDLSPINL